MIKEQYISFETAKLAKEKGFDEEFENMHVWNNFKGEILEDVSGYNMKNSHLCKNSYSAPTQSLLARWLREKHKIYLNIYFFIEYGRFIMQVIDKNGKYSPRYYITYEDAMESALQEALKLLP